MSLELTSQEQVFLITILRERQRELLREISRADLHEFRRGLQEREAILESVLRKLAAEGVSSAA